MNVLYCGDSNITDGVMISVLSLLDNITEELNVYIITAAFENDEVHCKGVPTGFAEFLDGEVKQLNSLNSVRLIDAGNLFCSELPIANLKTRFTPLCMLRLFADMIPELPDRILYLDNDVVCRKDCAEFYHQDMDGFEIAGSLDYYGRWFFKRSPFKMDYLNSGVLLLNMKLIREDGLFRKCRSMCRDKKMFMPDQSALNKLSGSKKILPRIFNEQRKLKDDTVFQHFTTSFRFFPRVRTVKVKPWNIEKLHDELKIYEYDDLLDNYLTLMSEYERSNSK